MKHTIITSLLAVFSLFQLQCGSVKQIEKTSLKEVLISAHRGGPTAGYPENALETLQNTAYKIEGVMLEIDVRTTLDGELILMHDKSLDRTTTLRGLVKNNTLETIKTAYLKDNNGKTTKMKVPTLEEVFLWTKNKPVYLTLDVKDKSAFRRIIDLVNKHQLKEKIEIITYTIPDAELVHNYDSDIYLSMSIGSKEVLKLVLNTRINAKKVSAFTGVSLKDKSLYSALQNNNIAVTLGTMGNLDNRAKSKSFNLFKQWKSLGINRFATDCPFEVYKVFKN